MTKRVHVTLAQVAEKSGVSLGTASYALRNASCIPEETAEKVRKAAKALGYKPNPRISALMSHIRQGRSLEEGETIALIWVDAPFGVRPYPEMYEGARQRALDLGYAFGEFWRTEPGMTDRRLQQILVSRGISGVLISTSSLPNPRFNIDWDWRLFSAAVIGTAECDPELHRSAHHHYGGMRMAVLSLGETGRKRIVAVLDKKTDERARRTWSAAFLAHYGDIGKSDDFLAQAEPAAMASLPDWLRARDPDALISTREMIEAMLAQGWAPTPDISVALLDWAPNPWRFGGVDQTVRIVATNAVDLVDGQLHRNEVGPPIHVKTVLSSGLWIAPDRAGHSGAPRLATPAVPGSEK